MFQAIGLSAVSHTSPPSFGSNFLTATSLCWCICPFLSARKRSPCLLATSIPRGLRLAKPQLISLTTLAIIFTVIINHPSPLLSCPLCSSLLSPSPHPPCPAPTLFSLLHSSATALLCCCLVPRRLCSGCSSEITLTGANGFDAIKVVRERCACKLCS